MVIEKEFVLTHVVKDVSKLTEERQFSKEEEFFGIPWKIGYCRKDGHFRFYLYCTPNCAGKWSVDTSRELRLVSVTGRNLKESGDYCYGEAVSWGYPKFCAWEDMMKNYVVDDKIILEVYVKIKKIIGIEKKKLRNFDESAKEFSDVVLVVEDQKFYVNRMYLASQSAYFKSLLIGNFKESGSIEIKIHDVSASDFQNFLEALYGELAIDDTSITGIIHLADMYATTTVIQKCEEFLVKESEKSIKEKLELATRFNLGKLKNHCLVNIKTVDDVRSVLTGDPTEMDPIILASLLRKAVSQESR